ncbi:hypothetical protein [Rhodococcus wratislaviensis]
MAKQQAAGTTKREAVRLLRRRISDRVFQVLRTNESALENCSQGPLSAAA